MLYPRFSPAVHGRASPSARPFTAGHLRAPARQRDGLHCPAMALRALPPFSPAMHGRAPPSARPSTGRAALPRHGTPRPSPLQPGHAWPGASERPPVNGTGCIAPPWHSAPFPPSARPCMAGRLRAPARQRDGLNCPAMALRAIPPFSPAMHGRAPPSARPSTGRAALPRHGTPRHSPLQPGHAWPGASTRRHPAPPVQHRSPQLFCVPCTFAV